MSARRVTAVVATTAALVAGVLGVQALPGGAPSARADGLTPYAGCDDLVTHYRRGLLEQARGWRHDVIVYDAAESSVGGATRSADGVDAAPEAVGPGATGTNVQEQGVDEPDIAKLADGRVVTLADNRLNVVSAEAQPRLLGSVRVGNDRFYPAELLLAGDRALVVSSGWLERQPEEPMSSGRGMDTSRIIAPGISQTRLSLYDLGGDEPRLLEESTYDGNYVSARLIDGTVRLVTSSSPYVPMVWPSGPSAAARLAARSTNEALVEDLVARAVLPQVVRTDPLGQVVERGQAVSCDETYVARGAKGTSTLLVTTMRPEVSLAATDSTAVTTDGDLVYSSTDRLYVGTSRWGTVMPVDGFATDIAVAPSDVTTEIHAFDITSSDGTEYVGSGTVPGYVYGRWAFSEHEGALRVATTQQPPWQPDVPEDSQEPSTSMVVKLAERNDRLVETGRIDGLGRTEQIKAVRYFGDLAAVVTFRQTDPLYLIDLSGDPRLLGELKIPGFSTYLHPIGDGLLLGVGNDATDQGQVTGMQLSTFDISDPTSPRQVDRISLGAGWSPALEDSRAFSYDPSRRLAALPFLAYDESTFAELPAAVGIRVGEDGTLSKLGQVELGPDAYLSRVLVGADSLFAVTAHEVVAADPATMARTGSLTY